MTRYKGKAAMSPPVKWYYLIAQVEYVNKITTWGLTPIWGYIHREEYELAREYWEEFKKRHADTHPWMSDMAELEA